MAGKYSDMSASAVPCIVSCRHTDPAICVGHDKALHVDDALLHSVASEGQASEYMTDMQRFAEVLRSIMMLPALPRETLFRRLRGMDFGQIRDDLSALHARPYTVQAIHARFVRAMQDNPTLATMIPAINEAMRLSVKAVQSNPVRRSKDAK